MIRARNFKSYEKGSLLGFFDLGYGGLVVRGCRLMDSGNGPWIAMPSQKVDKDDSSTGYIDHVVMAKPEADPYPPCGGNPIDCELINFVNIALQITQIPSRCSCVL